ncbi:gp436 family protein [Tropicimonas sp. S265A]|uniref:gp436 family protein n=1 Tax=Tropicimonas sp. S265A TaxID=3415134 RepID=UPI003C79C828
MSYAAPANLKARIPARDLRLLTDRDGVADTIDDTVLQGALDDATATINGWIAKRVALPLDPVPQTLETICCDLALERLYLNAGAPMPEAVTTLSENAMKFLKAVSEGKASLGDETGGEEVQSSPGVVLSEGEDPVFSRETLKGF